MKTRTLAVCSLFLLCTLAIAQQGKIAVPGTITGVTAGTDLTGGGTNGTVTLNLDTTKVPQLKTANTFTGNQTISGNISASGTVNGASYLIGGTPFAFGSTTNYNAFLGFAGNSTMSGTYNTGGGYQALPVNTTGEQNTAFGAMSLYSNQTGIANTALGVSSLAGNTTGDFNVAVGSALSLNTTGTQNTGVGVGSLANNTTGAWNTAAGADALWYNTTGSLNTAIGNLSGTKNYTGSQNTFLGYNTGTSTLAPLSNATAIGASAAVGASNAMILGGTSSSSVTVGIGTTAPYSDYALDVETIHSNGVINGGVVVNATGGNLYLGMTNTVHKFRVDYNGAVYADGGLFAGGADFAESVAVRGERSLYKPGQILEIARGAHRTLALTQSAYSTRVAGIYSTKPGVLASPHTISEKVEGEVPLAVVGIVPCNVTATNGAIHEGDLLVSSSLPGYAMKGTDRSRMLGAVIGKAMEPLASGSGTIQVLVTLQ